MRNISFMLTTGQIRGRTKTVTRRMGWAFAKVGVKLMAVEKSQGLGRGGKIVRLGPVRLIDVRREPLDALVADLAYGYRETALEGFPAGSRYSDPFKFVNWFCSSHRGCTPSTIITRLEFEYL